ncbi:MAG: ankyrin repeat domain-containing protein [Janthinobacterium lividum]
MQRLDFQRNDFVSSFRREGFTEGVPLPSLPPHPEDYDLPAAFPQQASPTIEEPRPAQPIRPVAPRKKSKFSWWTVFCLVPTLVMIGWGIAHPDPDTALVQAAKDGNLAEASSALAQGANVDAACGCERTALSWAATNGHTAVASLLIAKGASVNTPDDSSDTALTMAAWEKHWDIVSLLVAHQANVNQVNQKGGTALWFAVQDHQFDAARTLVAHKANPNVPGTRGWTMLMDATRAGSLPLVKMLASHGATINARSLDGDTAYGEALIKKRPDIAAVLLKAGAVPAKSHPDTVPKVITSA